MTSDLIEICSFIIIFIGLIGFFYSIYCIFIGRQIFIPNSFHNIVLVLLFFINPSYQGAFSTDLSPQRFIGLGILVPAIIILLVVKFQQGKYIFFHDNLTKDVRVIAEHALDNLGIAHDVLRDATKLCDYENTALLYSSKNAISFRQVKDKALRQRIIKEIREIMDTYTKPNKKTGLIFLFFNIGLLAFVGFIFQIRFLR